MSHSRHLKTWTLIIAIATLTLIAVPTVSAGRADADVAVLRLKADENTGTVCGAVYQDWDQDGTRDAEEPGLGGATIGLIDIRGIEVAQLVTGLDGSYRFEGVTPGEYIVVEEDPFGYSSLSAGKETIIVTQGECTAVSFGDLLLLLAPSGDPSDASDGGAQPIALLPTTGDRAVT